MRRLSNSSIRLTLKRAKEDNGPKEFGLHYTFFANASPETSSNRKRTCTYTFQNDQRCPSYVVSLPEIDESDNSGAITVRCKLWRQTGSISKSEQIIIRTRIGEERIRFCARYQNFSNLSMNEVLIKKIVKSSTGESVMELKLILSRPIKNFLKMKLNIIPLDPQFQRSCKIAMILLDASGTKTDFGSFLRMFVLQSKSLEYVEFVKFDLPVVSEEILKEKSAQYLANDTLSYRCIILFSPGIEYEEMKRTEDEQDSTSDIKQTDISNTVEFLTSKQNKLCDTKLQTATETFSAHTDILSAHSPIFESMFKTKTEETIHKCVHLDDMDAETVCHMLMFLYSNTLEEIDWKDAVKLYIAADKYQVLSLKQKCAVILKQSIDLSNCCIMFYLADVHQDDNLKRCAQKYIAKYDRLVLSSDQWMKLERKQPHLAIYYFRDQYLERSLFKL